jgi:hypothetical protein
VRFGATRRVGGKHAADCGELARRRSSPEVASPQTILARDIAIIDFIKYVGRGVFLFSLYFTDGK